MRELGGYPTSDGRRTRWKTFLRADSMDRLPQASQAALIHYGLRTVIDLRRNREVEEAPNVFADSTRVAYHHQNMAGDDPLAGSDDALETGEPADRILRSYSRILDLRQPQVRETLATLAAPGAHPAVYHCAGGTDRTGIISALLLGIGGVPPATIAEDYALTARYVVHRYLAELAPPGVSADNYTWEDHQAEFCPPEAMLGVLRYLEDRYGGVEEYVRTIGLSQGEIESIRTTFVE